MICYKDMTFCIAVCANNKCGRKYTQTVVDAANKWWNPSGSTLATQGAPIAVSDFSKHCSEYAEVVFD